MRCLGLLLLSCLAGDALGQACVVHSRSERVEVTVCQENRTIPDAMFRTGFCKPSLPGQSVEVEFVERCPAGAFGVCQNAQVSNMPYRQDIHYYGVATDARFLKPACEGASKGQWQAK